MNVYLYVPYRIVNYEFDQGIIFSKVVAQEPGKISNGVFFSTKNVDFILKKFKFVVVS